MGKYKCYSGSVYGGKSSSKSYSKSYGKSYGKDDSKKSYSKSYGKDDDKKSYSKSYGKDCDDKGSKKSYDKHDSKGSKKSYDKHDDKGSKKSYKCGDKDEDIVTFDAVADALAVTASEGAGDVDINVLDNDINEASSSGGHHNYGWGNHTAGNGYHGKKTGFCGSPGYSGKGSPKGHTKKGCKDGEDTTEALVVKEVNGDVALVGVWLELAEGGKVLVEANGTLDFDAAGDFDYLAAGETTEVTVSYTAENQDGETDEAVVVITITGVDDNPEAGDIGFITDEDTAVSGDILANSSDIDGDTITVASTSLGAVGEAIAVTTAGGYTGTLTVNADGTFTYTPGADANGMEEGETDSLTFTFTADANGLTDEGTVTIDITGSADGPVVEDAELVTDEDTAGSTDLLAGATAAVGGALSVAATSVGALDTAIAVTTDGGYTGTITVGADGSATYTPGADANAMSVGETDTFTFTYTVAEVGGGETTATATITIDGANDGVAVVAITAVADEDNAVSGNVLEGATDTDGDAVTVSAISAGNIGESIAVTTAGGYTGTLVVAADGSYTFTPGADANGMAVGETDSYSFTYTATDGNGAEATETVTITIDGANDAMDVVDNAFTGDEDAGATGNVLDGSSDIDGDALTVTSSSVAFIGQPISVVTAGGRAGTFTLNSDGSFTFVPTADTGWDEMDAGDTDTLTFTFEATDGNGSTDTATATITFEGVNDGPVAVADVVTTQQEIAVSGNVLTNDSDYEGHTYEVTGINAGALATPIVLTNVNGYTGTLTVNADGSFDFVPSEDTIAIALGETELFTFEYTVTDEFGAESTATATIEVEGLNDDPVANIDAFAATDEDNTVSFNILNNDTDVDASDVLSVSGTSLGSTGVTLSVTSAGGREGTLIIRSDGEVIFDPGQGFQGMNAGETDVVTFEYEASDGNGGLTTSYAEITVEGLDEVDAQGEDHINMVFLVDVSSSMFQVDTGIGVLDRNNDGLANTRLDLVAEMYGSLAQTVDYYLGVYGRATTVTGALIGFGETETYWGEWEAIDGDLYNASDNLFDGSADQNGEVVNAFNPLDAAVSYMENVAINAEQTVVYYFTDSDINDPDSGFGELSDTLLNTYGADVEAVALTNDSYYDYLGDIDAGTGMGDTWDVVTNSAEAQNWIFAEAFELVF